MQIYKILELLFANKEKKKKSLIRDKVMNYDPGAK